MNFSNKIEVEENRNIKSNMSNNVPIFKNIGKAIKYGLEKIKIGIIGLFNNTKSLDYIIPSAKFVEKRFLNKVLFCWQINTKFHFTKIEGSYECYIYIDKKSRKSKIIKIASWSIIDE